MIFQTIKEEHDGKPVVWFIVIIGGAGLPAWLLLLANGKYAGKLSYKTGEHTKEM